MAFVLAHELDLYEKRSLRPESYRTISLALQNDAVARRVLAKGASPESGEIVGVRLNINVLKSSGVAVHSIHRATSSDGHKRGKGLYRGEVISYLPVVVLRDAFFNVHQPGREAIALGRSDKHPMASIDGALMKKSRGISYDGIEISFNPKRTHLFVDSEGYAVRRAEEVTILGHRAYARGLIEYFDAVTAPTRAGDAPSTARFRRPNRINDVVYSGYPPLAAMKTLGPVVARA